MTSDEALGQARHLWAPYAAEAEGLGFRIVEERLWEWTERGRMGHSGLLHFYREPTFLDFYASIPDGVPPPGTLPGFGGVQLYTFVRGERLEFILPNGERPDAPRSVVGDLIDRLLKLPEDLRTLRMTNGASDLQAVVERHQRVLGSRRPLVPAEPVLETRWTWMEEIEREGEVCC